MSLDRILGRSIYESLSVNDGFLSGDFQKVVQVFFQLGKSFGGDCVEIGLISDFLDMNWEFDFVELINEVVDFPMSHGLRGFRCARVEHAAVETS